MARTVRGARANMPAGTLVGRVKGSGAAQILSLQDVANALTAGGYGVASAPAPGGAPVVTVAAGTGINVGVSGSAYTVSNTGVLSLTAGTGISVSAATGAITVSNTHLTLASDTDVTITSPANNDVLTYETSSSKWKNKPASAGATTLAALTDVNLGSLVGEQTLTYNATAAKWDNEYTGSQRSWHQLCIVAAAAALPACTYANGSSGDGATLTANANGALTIDGATSPVFTTGDRVLIPNQADAKQNGIYVITQLGDGSHPFILTRAPDFNNTSVNVSSWSTVTFCVPVAGGIANAKTIWVFSGTNGTGFTFGTATWLFAKIAAPGIVTAAVGSVTFSISGAADRDLLYYDNASGLWKNTTLTAEIDAAIGSTRGSILERGAGGWGLLTPGTAGLFLKSAGAGADPLYAAVSGAGVGLFGPVMTAPPAAATLPFTTWANQGTSTIADNAVGYTLAGQLASHNDEWRLRYFTGPATPYTYTALLAVTYTGSNIGGALLGWYDGTKLQGMRLINNGGAWQIFISSFTGLGNAFQANQVGPLVYSMTTLLWVRINNDGTNITFSISADGVNFDTIYTVAKASGALGSGGYTNVAFGVEANSRICYATLMSWLQT